MEDKREDVPVEEIMKVTFKNKEQRDKLKSGEIHSDKGLRRDNGRTVTQPDMEFLDEGLIKALEELQESQGKEAYQEEQYDLIDDIKEYTKSVIKRKIAIEIDELLNNPEKREIFLGRINSLWHRRIVPAGNKLSEKAKFAKDVAHAVVTNEQPKALRLLEESKSTEIKEVSGESSEEQFVEITEEQRNRLILAMRILADVYNQTEIIKRDESGVEYQLEKSEKDKFLIEKTGMFLQTLMGKDFKLTSDEEKVLLEYLQSDMEKEPLLIQS
ncbi:MAG TPA: hypothetical protein IAA26_09555 [Candidatus Blautia faecipullorum]|nr:hypothetical protein [Candidatus Blautia faecipullorum]